MPTKNLSSSFNSWLLWSILAALVLTEALVNAWYGFPWPASAEAIYGTVGGILPYSDAEAYLSGAHRFIELGYLDAWNMRRPLNTLLLGFYLKMTNLNFWYAILIQMGLCVFALTIYLKTLQEELGTLSALLSLIFIYYYAHMYINTTLSEILGLTVGLLTFVLLWNGWTLKSRMIFNAGLVSLAVALNVRAGPNFMVGTILLLVFFYPISHTRTKDIVISILSFFAPFYLLTKLSTYFGDPTAHGMFYANLGQTLYGLVNGGKRWTFVYDDPRINSLLLNKSEAEQAIIMYKESWKIFLGNPLLLLIGMGKYMGAFFVWFLRLLTFGDGLFKIITTTISALWLLVVGIKVYQKRFLYYRAYLLLVFIFLGTIASAMIVFKDTGMRTFAVAIPFMGALLGFAFTKVPPQAIQNKPQNTLAIGAVAFIFLAAVMARYTPYTSEPSAFILAHEHEQDTILTFNLHKQPYLLINSSPTSHFRSISQIKLREACRTHLYSEEPLESALSSAIDKFQKSNFVLFSIYDYRSHSIKWVVAEDNILNSKLPWIEITTSLLHNGIRKIYQAQNYKEYNE